MAGLPGNVGWLMAQRQTSGRGTPGTVTSGTTHKVPFAGGNINPDRNFDQLSETDSSRDRGVSYVSSEAIEGSPEFYVRDASVGQWLYGVLGADAVTGTTDKTHTITPATALPYWTIWRNIADTLFERFEDCFVSSLRISADAGSPLRAVAAVQGRKAVRLTADPSTSPAIALESSYVYNYNDATVTLGGGATALVRSFEFTIDNNVARQQTDDVIIYDVVAGRREVSVSFDLIFTTLDEYNKFHYGGVSGTEVDSDIYSTSLLFEFVQGGGVFSSATNGLSLTVPALAYEEFPVTPNPGGDPIVVSVRGVSQRGGSPVCTAVVKNQIAAY